MTTLTHQESRALLNLRMALASVRGAMASMKSAGFGSLVLAPIDDAERALLEALAVAREASD